MITFLALTRLLALVGIFYSSVKHQDWLGILIGWLWVAALLLNTVFHNPQASALSATGLIYAVAFFIIKAQRRK